MNHEKNFEMKVEFTKDDLDYIAYKIAEIIMKDRKVAQNFGNAKEFINEKNRHSLGLSYRLYERLHDIMKINGYERFCLEDIAQFRSDDFKRVSGMGRKTHTELLLLIQKTGLTWGDQRLKFRA